MEIGTLVQEPLAMSSHDETPASAAAAATDPGRPSANAARSPETDVVSTGSASPETVRPSLPRKEALSDRAPDSPTDSDSRSGDTNQLPHHSSEDQGEPASDSSPWSVYFRCVAYKHTPLVIVVVWMVVLGIAGWQAPQLLSSTSTTFLAPPGTDAYQAQQVWLSNFPTQGHTSTLFILLSHSTGDPQTESMVDGFTLSANFTRYVSFTLNETIPQALASLQQAVDIPTSVFGYFLVSNPFLRSLFVNEPDHTTTVIVIAYSDKLGGLHVAQRVQDCVQALRSDLVLQYSQYDQYDISLTGVDALLSDAVSGSTSDMVSVDAIVLPVALVVLALCVQSFRLLLIPVISVAICVATSFMLMVPVALYVWSVASFVPSVMMSLVIAMSIDYSLFLLTRFNEEIKAGMAVPRAVQRMLTHAGHIVLISGSTLAVTFMGLVFFPLDVLRSVGVGCALALVFTMAVNLSLTPALLLLFPNFFSQFSTWNTAHSCKVVQRTYCCRKCCRQKRKSLALEIDNGAATNDEKQNGSVSVSPSASGLGGKQQSICFEIAKWSTSSPWCWMIIVAVLAFTVPIAFQLLHLQITTDDTQFFPRNSPAVAAYAKLKHDFSPGRVAPYYLIAVDEGGNGIWSAEFFRISQYLLATLLTTSWPAQSSTLMTARDITGISYMNGVPIDFGNFSQPALNSSSLLYQTDMAVAYRHVFQSQCNALLSSTFIELDIDADPLATSADSWVSAVRDVLSRTEFQSDISCGGSNNLPSGSASTPNCNFKFSWYLAGRGTQYVDAVNRIYAVFPGIIAVTVAMVFFVVGAIFRSVLVPLRLVLSLSLPISWVYGMSVLAFQDGKFNWLTATLESSHAIYWLTPVMSFSILVGLGLDYDMFLFSRIVEYRKLMYSHRDAIIHGVDKTGSIITAAGIIMAIAFAGLMMSSSLVLNEFGFVLCFAVLLDTFVIRTLLVPAVVFLLGEANWWPGSMPPPLPHDVPLHTTKRPDLIGENQITIFA